VIIPCYSTQTLWRALPDGLALYPLARGIVPGDWQLADDSILEQVDRLERPVVYIDLGRIGLGRSAQISSLYIGRIISLGQRVEKRGGRVVLCEVRPTLEEVFEVFGLVRGVRPIPYLSVGGRRMPGGGLLDPAWLAWNDGTVAALARRVDEDQDFGLLPVLGDALEDAGCTHMEILDHCRSAGPHSRSCWVLRLLLGKP
jgi:hypothetical protein